MVRVKLPLVGSKFRRVVTSPISTQLKLMGKSPVDVHTRLTDWPITTGGTGCIVVPLGGSEDAVRLGISLNTPRYQEHCGGEL